MPTTVVTLPTYNEIENLPRMVEALLALPVADLRVLVVDDNSPDGTGQRADALAQRYPGRVFVLHRAAKGGLGPAYIAGFTEALRLGADYVIQMDADFSHQPRYIPQMVTMMEQGYDLVVGSRYVKGGGVDQNWHFLRKLLSWFANRIYVHYLLRVPILDATGGYKIWRRRTLASMDLASIRSNGYVFQVEMTYVAWRLGFRLGEIPIYFPDREIGESKMNSRIAAEAALGVWQIMYRHHQLTPAARRSEA